MNRTTTDGTGAAATADGTLSLRETDGSAARVCVVVNRKAGGGDSDLGPALDVLTDAFGPPLRLDLDVPARLNERLEAVSTSVERIVVAGGDGTVSSALDVLLRVRKPLGILPIGTANDFARTLGIPAGDMRSAADIIVEGRTRLVDVGTVNGRFFLNAAGIGFSTNLHREVPAWAKRVLGPLAYPYGVVRRWRRHRPFTVEIIGGEKRLKLRAIQVTIANGRFYGGGMIAEQDAQVDDGWLDLIVVLPSPWWRHVSSVIGLKRGVYPARAPVFAERLAAFELRTRRAHSIATDGEPAESTPASFGVRHRALEVYTP